MSAALLVLATWKHLAPHPDVQAEIDARERGMTSVVKPLEHDDDDYQSDGYESDTSSRAPSRASTITRNYEDED